MRGVRALATLLSLLVPAAFPAAALAHATLLRSNPRAGTVVAHAPARIVLHFDQPVQDAGTTVVAGSGASVLAGHARLEHGDSRSLVVPLRSGLANGDYTVRWRVGSAGGQYSANAPAGGRGLGGEAHSGWGGPGTGVARAPPPRKAATTESSALDWP